MSKASYGVRNLLRGFAVSRETRRLTRSRAIASRRAPPLDSIRDSLCWPFFFLARPRPKPNQAKTLLDKLLWPKNEIVVWFHPGWLFETAERAAETDT